MNEQAYPLLMSTTALETELAQLSASINTLEETRVRYQDVRDELKNRREKNMRNVDYQPPPTFTTEVERREESLDELRRTTHQLELKITMMEAEQAKLAVEVEHYKFVAREAEERLALVRKHYKEES